MKSTVYVTLLVGFLALIPAIAAADSTVPEVTITSPEEGFTVTDDAVVVEVAFAAPQDATVSQVDLVVDGVIVDTRVIEPPETSGAVSFEWPARAHRQ